MTSRTWQSSGIQRLFIGLVPLVGVGILVVGSILVLRSKGPTWFGAAFLVLVLAVFAANLRWSWWQVAWKVELTDTELRMSGPRRSWTLPLADLTRVGRALNQQQYYIATEREKVYLAPMMRDGTRLVIELSALRPDLLVTGS